jgi:hypothetical protein
MTTPNTTHAPGSAGAQPLGYPLHRELLAYRREPPGLLERGEADRFALIKGDELQGFWDTQRDALQAGRDRFGLEPICVKRIDPRDVELLDHLLAIQGTVLWACSPASWAVPVKGGTSHDGE